MAADLVLLDTCALIWWTLDPERLSENAKTVIDETLHDSKLLISAISIWEIAIKVKRGKLDLGLSPRNFREALSQTNSVEIIAVDEEIWLQSVELDWTHSDPADRVIVATADSRSARIVTPDSEISRFRPSVVW